MNSILAVQLEDWKNGEIGRAHERYIAANHDPSAPENRIAPNFGSRPEIPKPAPTTALFGKAVNIRPTEYRDLTRTQERRARRKAAGTYRKAA